MAETEDKVDTEKRERPKEAEDKAEEPPAKQQKVSDDSKEEDGKAAEGNEEVAAPVEPKSDMADIAKIDGAAEAKVEETVDPDEEPSKDVEKTEEAVASPPPAPAVEAPVPAPAPAPAPTATIGPSTATGSSMPPGLPPDFSASNLDAPVEERGTVSALYVGRVIGKGGEMIRDLQARSSCRIDVDQNVPQGQPRVITYKGTRRTVDFAKRLVHMLCQDSASEADLPLGDARREFLIVPAQSVGKIIGRGGEMIRELQARSQAKIQVDHNSHNGMDQQKQVTMTGNVQAVTKAKEMILFLVANPLMDANQSITMLIEDKVQRGGVWGSGPPYPNLPNMGQNMQPDSGGVGGYGGAYDQQPYYGGHPGVPSQTAQPYVAPFAPYAAAPPPQAYQQPVAPTPYGQYNAGVPNVGTETEVFFAAKTFMGRIIGSKGVTINDLQRRSGTDLQINQDVPPGRECEITIRGPRHAIEIAKQMLREIIEIGPNHPYAGGGIGGPPNAGGHQQGGYGQQADPYGYQNAQPGGYRQGGYGESYGQQSQGYNQGYQAQAFPQPHTPYQPTPAPYSSPPVAAPAPVSEWKSAASPDGQVYYYNERTGQTQWEKPFGMP